MADITTQIVVGAAGSLLASLVVFILGWITKRGAVPAPPTQQNIGVKGPNYGTVHFDQSQTTTNIHSSAVIHNGPTTGSTDNDFPWGWVIGAGIAALALGVLVASYWRSVVALILPFDITMTALMLVLVIIARNGLRGRHILTLCLGIMATSGSIVAFRLLPGISDISRAVSRADDIGGKAAVIIHLSPDKSVQLASAGVSLAGLIMFTALLVWMTAAASAANSVPFGATAGRLHGLVSASSGMGTLVATSVMPTVLVVAGFWTVADGFRLISST